MKLILSYADADFDILASMLAARLLHPGAEAALPRRIPEDARIYLAENRGLLSFADQETLEAEPLEELILLGSPRGARPGDLDLYREKARHIRAYALPEAEAEGPGGPGETGEPGEEGRGALTSHMAAALERQGLPLSPAQAGFLALAIYKKTRSLTCRLKPRDFKALAYLFDRGADLSRITPYLPEASRAGRQLFFEKVAANHKIRTIGGYRVLFCLGEATDYLAGLGLFVQQLLKVAKAHLALVIFPFHGNNYVNAVTLEDTALDLRETLVPFGAEGDPLYASFFRQGNPPDLFEELAEHLYRHLSVGVRAGDIMDRYVRSIPPETTFSEARVQLERRGVTTLAVAGEEGFLGTVSLQDVDKALRFDYHDLPVEKYMEKTGPRATPNTSLDVLLRQMAANPGDILPVLDRRGRLQGAVSPADLIQALYQERHPLVERPTAITASLGGNMEKLIEEKAPKYLQGLLYMLGKAAADLGFSAYVVGGFVRDLIHGLGSEDLDVVVEGNALALARKVKEVTGGRLQENPDFGTASIATSRHKIDFSTARQEFYAFSAALPEVERSSLKKDLYRRDFTVNTLAFQINPESFGRLFDFYGGLKDLEDRILRVLYSLSFVEDPLRILRAVRFSVRLGFDLEPETRNLLKKALKSRALHKVSKDRLTRELELACREKRVVLLFKELAHLGVLEQIFPHVSLKPENTRILGNIEELYLMQEEEEREKISLLPLYLAGLLTGAPARELFSRVNRLRLTRREMEILTQALEQGEAAADILTRDGLPPEEVYGIFSTMTPETSLYVLARSGDARAREYYQRYTRDLKHLAPAVTGKELLNLGLEPGPLFKDILSRLKTEKIKGNIQGIEDEILFIRKHYLA